MVYTPGNGAACATEILVTLVLLCAVAAFGTTPLGAALFVATGCVIAVGSGVAAGAVTGWIAVPLCVTIGAVPLDITPVVATGWAVPVLLTATYVVFCATLPGTVC